MCRPMADRIQLAILIVFAVLILLLAQSRELMRQITRTAEEWHRMRDAIRGQDRKSLTSLPDPAAVDDGGPDDPSDIQPGSQ